MSKISMKEMKIISNIEAFTLKSFTTIAKDGFPMYPVHSYLHHLHNANKAPNTIESYTRYIMYFLQWLDKQGIQFENLRVVHLEEYKGSLQQQGENTTTIKAYIGEVRRFLQWCLSPESQAEIFKEKHEGIRGGYFDYLNNSEERKKLVEIKTPQERSKNYKHLVSSDVSKIREWIREYYDYDIQRYRLYSVIFELMVSAGLRRGEVLSLPFNCIEVRNERGEVSHDLKVQNSPDPKDRELLAEYGESLKTGERQIPITSKLAETVARWKVVRPVESSHGLLLSNPIQERYGKMFTRRAIQCFFDTMNQHCKDLSVNVVHPHMLRHTYATELAEHGLGIDDIAFQLGHGNIESSAKYIHQSGKQRRDKLANIYARSSILSGEI